MLITKHSVATGNGSNPDQDNSGNNGSNPDNSNNKNDIIFNNKNIENNHHENKEFLAKDNANKVLKDILDGPSKEGTEFYNQMTQVDWTKTDNNASQVKKSYKDLSSQEV